MKKLTPVLCVEAIEPCLDFWTKRLGFEKTMEVPEGDLLGFAALARGKVEIMYQTFNSLKEDLPSVAEQASGGQAFLYIEVEDLDDVLERLKGVDPLVPLRTTFYGAREIAVREPGGNVVVFAQFGAPEQS